MCRHLQSSPYGWSRSRVAARGAPSAWMRSVTAAMVARRRRAWGLSVSVESVADFVAYFAR